MIILPITHTKCQAQDAGILLAPIVNEGVKMLGNYLIDKAFEKNHAGTENIKVGKHEIRISEDDSYIFFKAYDDNNVLKTGLRSNKKNPEHVAKIEAYKKMNDLEKKQYLREVFLKHVNFDLGPVEETPVKAAETPAAKETASATTPQTTETAPAPEN